MCVFCLLVILCVCVCVCVCDFQCKSDGREASLCSLQLHCDWHRHKSYSFLWRLTTRHWQHLRHFLTYSDWKCVISYNFKSAQDERSLSLFRSKYAGLSEDEKLWYFKCWSDVVAFSVPVTNSWILCTSWLICVLISCCVWFLHLGWDCLVCVCFC